jgi:predicted nucleic acid-binding protein
VIDARRGQEAIDDLTVWPLTRYPHDLLLARIGALRHNLTAYDAAYVALAEALQAILVTCDTRLAASSGHRATIAVG